MFNKKNITESENLKKGDRIEVTTSKGRTYQGTFDRKNDNGSVVYRTTSNEPNVHSRKDKGTEKTHISVVTKKHLKSIKKLDEIDYSDNKFKQMMGTVTQQKTPQQHMEELESVLYELKSVERNIQEITREIKYDRTAQDIMVRVDKIINPFRPYIEDIDYREPFEQIQEAVNQLESAIYGLDELAKRAEYTISTQIQNIQDEIDYPDDDDEQLREGLYPGEYYTFLVKFDDGTTEKLNFSSDDIDWDRVGAKRNKKVVDVRQQGGIQGEPHNTPNKPHDFPDDRGLARAQRAYDRQIPESKYQGQYKTKEDAIQYAKEKVKSFRDPEDGIEIWELPSGGFDVVHTMNSNGRNHVIANGGKKLGTIGARHKGVKENATKDQHQQLKVVEYIKKQGYGNLLNKMSVKEIIKLIDNEKNDWHKDDDLPEAANPAQQAAIAISMKKAGKKPKVTNEDIENYVESMHRHGYESVEEQKCPECGGIAYSDKMIAEEKDACYHKVKSRYKIWPSAYASGALVKCRKAGAKNWGNKSKK